jgi:ankyrin repeat protein
MNLHIIFCTTLFFLNTTLHSMDIPDLGKQLRRAVKNDQTELALALIAAGAPVNLEPFKPTSFGAFGEDDLKLSALQLATITGNQILVHALIQAGASLTIEKIPFGARLHLNKGSEAYEVAYHEKTSLIYAAEYGHAECVKQLLAAKAEVDDVDRQDNTALVWAITGRYIDCVCELITAKAHVNIGSPLIIAARIGDAACVRELIAAKAVVHDTNQYERTPLLEAAASGNVLCVRELIAARALVNHVTNENHTALMQAVSCGHTAIAKELIALGARLRWRGVKRMNSVGEFEEVPSVLYWATRNNREVGELVVEALLKVPNEKQKLSIITFFGLIKRKISAIGQSISYRNRDSFFKGPLSEALRTQNRNNFAESVAGEEMAKLKLFYKGFAPPTQIYLLNKYANAPNTTQSQSKCSIQ